MTQTTEHQMDKDNQTCLTCGKTRCTVCGLLTDTLVNGWCLLCRVVADESTRTKNVHENDLVHDSVNKELLEALISAQQALDSIVTHTTDETVRHHFGSGPTRERIQNAIRNATGG